MKIWWRWLKLVFTCGLGNHAEFKHYDLTDKYQLTECPRCHMAIYNPRGKDDYRSYQPPLWDVARGLYDRGIHHP